MIECRQCHKQKPNSAVRRVFEPGSATISKPICFECRPPDGEDELMQTSEAAGRVIAETEARLQEALAERADCERAVKKVQQVIDEENQQLRIEQQKLAKFQQLTAALEGKIRHARSTQQRLLALEADAPALSGTYESGDMGRKQAEADADLSDTLRRKALVEKAEAEAEAALAELERRKAEALAEIQELDDRKAAAIAAANKQAPPAEQ